MGGMASPNQRPWICPADTTVTGTQPLRKKKKRLLARSVMKRVLVPTTMGNILLFCFHAFCNAATSNGSMGGTFEMEDKQILGSHCRGDLQWTDCPVANTFLSLEGGGGLDGCSCVSRLPIWRPALPTWTALGRDAASGKRPPFCRMKF